MGVQFDLLALGYEESVGATTVLVSNDFHDINISYGVRIAQSSGKAEFPGQFVEPTCHVFLFGHDGLKFFLGVTELDEFDLCIPKSLGANNLTRESQDPDLEFFSAFHDISISYNAQIASPILNLDDILRNEQ
jgi:hypothetical protein